MELSEKKERIESYIRSYQELLEEKGFAAGPEAVREKMYEAVRSMVEETLLKAEGSDKIINVELVAEANLAMGSKPDMVLFRLLFEYDPIKVTLGLKAAVLEAGELKLLQLPQTAALLYNIAEFADKLQLQRLKQRTAVPKRKQGKGPRR